jgi:hypothetical protein
MINRRELLQGVTMTAALRVGTALGSETLSSAEPSLQDPALPWYRRSLRWGQTNIRERDVVRYDIRWWREYWKRIAIDGVVISAGGLVAYYPTKIPLHRRAEFLNDRDLYGELAHAAQEEGLAVLARVDFNNAGEEFFRAHPDWFTCKQSGQPYRDGEWYAPCINGPYFSEHAPRIMREIIDRTHPQGLFHNGWLIANGHDQICYCVNCVRKFRDEIGLELPKGPDWEDTAYQQWIQWSYEKSTELFDFYNRITREAGGPDCIWPATFNVCPVWNIQFVDLEEIAKRSELVFIDDQCRIEGLGFQQNGDAGKRMCQLTGWDKRVVEVVTMSQVIVPPMETEWANSDDPNIARLFPVVENNFELTARPESEVRLWMIEAIAGGMGLSCFMVGAFHEDRRFFRTSQRLMQWHRRHEQYLIKRRPMAAVGVVWSQRNTDYFGRTHYAEQVGAPYQGFIQALIRARIPYLPVHATDIGEQSEDLAVLVLPNVGVLSDAECEAIRRFAKRGGAVIATGATSLYNEWGTPRRDFELADLFGAHAPSSDFGMIPAQVDTSYLQSYLQLTPELNNKVSNPSSTDQSAARERHPVLRGFEETDIIPFGGKLVKMRVDDGTVVPLTFVPVEVEASGIGESMTLRQLETDIPGLVLNVVGDARIAYLPADIDRRYVKNYLPDLGNLLANIVRWAARERIGFELQGPGLIDCHVYRQPGRMIVHLINLTNAGVSRAPVEEFLQVGPLKLRMKLAEDVRERLGVECLVSGAKAAITLHQHWVSVEIKSILDHEVLVIS